jgi:hypothetical protein
MQKVALVAFNGETMCFAHALLNALDMHSRNYDVKLIIEGSATRQILDLNEPGKPFADLYAKVKAAGLITAVCRACASKMGSLEAAEAQSLPLVGEMSGHPPLAEWVQGGYQVITL